MKPNGASKKPTFARASIETWSDLFSRDGIASDDTMKNVVQLVRDTRKSKDDKTMADIFDWSFAKKAQAELKTALSAPCSCVVIVLGF